MHSNGSSSGLTFIGRDTALARGARQVNRFLHVEAAVGVLLLIATATALIWANSPWSESYHDLWHIHLNLHVGSYALEMTMHEFVNDALMALFFFVVGLEIKRELVVGQLKNPRDAMLPAIAALGGMVVPAAVYVAFNLGTDGINGWGIPMATDIAFAVGVVSLLGDRVPKTLKIFLLTLAIVDDIGAILVIAVFYTTDLSMQWLAVAGGLVATMVVMKRLGVWFTPVYVVIGLALWLATFESGIHATIAGVLMGLMTPAKPIQNEGEVLRIAQDLEDKEEVSAYDVREASFHLRESVSVAARLENTLHPYTGYVIVPLFALANAGVALSGDSLAAASTSAVTLGVAMGLLVGKTVGVTGATMLAVRLGISKLPKSMSNAHLVAMSVVAGIGFTVSLFITNLAFAGDGEGLAAITEEAKIGILAASFTASLLGLFLLSRARPTGLSDDMHVIDTGVETPRSDLDAMAGAALATVVD